MHIAIAHGHGQYNSEDLGMEWVGAGRKMVKEETEIVSAINIFLKVQPTLS